MAKAKADFSLLWGDEQLADVTIKIKIKPEEPAAAAPAAVAAAAQDGSNEQQGQEQEGSQRPAAKRRRTEDGEGVQSPLQQEEHEQKQEQQEEKQEQEQQQEQEGEAMMVGGDVEAGVVATLRVHGIFLAQRSAYFKGLLLGAGAAMTEGQGKTVTVELADEQEVADFQQLIKLSYMSSYTQEPDGSELSKEELLRLLVLADAFEMSWCVDECAQALRSFNGYDEALAYLRRVPDALLMQTPALSKSTKVAGDVLAEALGPVEKLWVPAEAYNDDKWWKSYVLDERVVALPIGGMEALLRSEELQLTSENYAFSLAYWWIKEQEGDADEVRQPFFNRLLKCLRYARMSAEFVTSIVDDPWVADSGLLPYIIRRAFWRRDSTPRSFELPFPSSRVQIEDRESYTCTFTTHFTRTAVEALQQPYDKAIAPLGLLHGFPCYLQLEREDDDEFGLHLSSWFLQTHDAGPFHTPGEPRWEGQDKDEHRGFEYTLVRGKLGPINLPQNMPCDERVADSTCLLTFPANELAYDANGKLEVC